MTEQESIFALSRRDTASLKGIAIIAMLCHHLYADPPVGTAPCSEFLQWIGTLGKFCVAMFLFCSGYGLSAGYSTRKVGALRFMLHRFAKFYSNYWVVFLICVPIGIYCFGIPLRAAYGETVNVIKRLAFDLLGIQGSNSYNITWWFNKLILIFWLIFPVIFAACRKSVWVTLFCALGMSLFYYKFNDYGYLPFVLIYMLPFTMGIAWHQLQDKLIPLQKFCSDHNVTFVVVSVIFLIASIFFRMNDIIPKFSMIRMDGFVTLSFALLLVSLKQCMAYAPKVLPFLGKHTANIYLTHTFIYSYWPSKYLINNVLPGGGKDIRPSCCLPSCKYVYRMAQRHLRLSRSYV